MYKKFTVIIALLFSFSITSQLCEAETGKKLFDQKEQPRKDNDTTSNKTERSGNKAPVSNTPTYRPPKRGAPQARIGGGTRGSDDKTLYISVITPNHTGYAAHAQPTLFWFTSDSAPTQFELTLINDQDIQPMVEAPLNKAAGIHAVRLSDYGITLEQGKSYQWSVAAVFDENHRSRDILSSGRIRYIEASEELKAQLKHATSQETIYLYAEAGFWYDAYATLSELISKDPTDLDLLKQRVSLLRQAELPVASSFAGKQVHEHANKALPGK
jgi:hypothetical protein